MQDCKDGRGFQFIKFDFVTGEQEIKTAIFVGILTFLSRIILSFY